MSWRKVFRRGLTVIFILASLLTAVVVAAAIQIFDGTGQYIMSDFENHDIAKQRAQQRAERDAQKQAGVYLKTFSRSVNSELTDDEISAVTNNIIKVSDVKIVPVPFETNGEAGLMYRATLKASIDPEGIYDYIKRDSKEKVTIVQQNNGLQDAIAKNDALIEDLKEQYKRATSQAEKNRIIKQMKQVDRDFLANQKLEEGLKLHYTKDYNEAIKFYDETLKLKPDSYWAYTNRGCAYSDLGQKERAIQDFNKAIKINPNHGAAYNNRANNYVYLKQYEKAIQDYTKSIKLNPNVALPYNNRGNTYQRIKQYSKSIADYDKAIELNPYNANYYNNRGITYVCLGNLNQAISDTTKAIELNPNLWQPYIIRGLCYQKLGDEAKAQADFAKAKELGWKG